MHSLASSATKNRQPKILSQPNRRQIDEVSSVKNYYQSWSDYSRIGEGSVNIYSGQRFNQNYRISR